MSWIDLRLIVGRAIETLEPDIHGRHHRGELAVRMHSHDGQAIVRVRDSGIGIVPEALPLIFDLFKQAETAGERTSGFGIGLALVRDLVELHGGSVTAHSAGREQGSEFTVCLPVEG